jgi:serine/threonine protein phosphatase PrpC
MGNELLNEEDKKDKEPKNDYSNDFIKYGVVTKRGEEKSYDDNYLLIPKLSIPEDPKKNDFSLFGVFDGHNSGFLPESLVKNVPKFYEKEILNINKDNYKTKIEEIFKNIDKEFKPNKNETKKFEIKEIQDEDEEEEKEDEEKKENEKNQINENKETKKKEEINYINVDVDKKEFNYIKKAILNSKEIPEEFKEIDDNELENLLLFKNLFQYNNNYLYNNNNVNYIGSSASIVLINEDSVITADLGITKCILFNKEGIILNSKDNKESKNYGDYKVEHTFNNQEEKKRIKRFNKSIDYNSLKMNFYVPASRCFGFFKYKEDEILKEENQIISCVPDVYIYDKKDVDYILLITKGAAPIGDTLIQFMKKIKEINGNNEGDNNQNIKLSDLINEYLKCKKEEVEKMNANKIASNPSSSVNKATTKANSSIYIGKEDFGEENAIINELNNSYYKDIMSMNKTNDCHGNYNSTCILIQLLKNQIKTPDGNENKEIKIENKENEKNSEEKDTIKGDNKNEIKVDNKSDNVENQKEGETIKNDNDIKEEKKEEEKDKKA